MDIFEFDISPTAGPVTKRDLGSCAFETGKTEGIVVKPGDRPVGPHSFGGGLTVKTKVEENKKSTGGVEGVVEKVKETVLGS